jgi:hypothetical protein
MRGPDILKLRIRVKTGRFPSRPYVGWHLAAQVFCADDPGTTRETTWSGFDRGGGALAPV